jgi:hypothetical protein
MGKGHPLNPLAAAICSSIALGFIVAAGYSCSFLQVKAKGEEILVILETSAQEARTTASLGVLCQGDFYSIQDDSYWLLSRLFFIVSVCCGCVTTATAWATTTFALPTKTAWKAISVASAVTSVLQVPVFILFQAEPCSKYNIKQHCVLSMGAYLVIASVAFWFLVTLITQMLDPPSWVHHLSHWRARKAPEDSRDLLMGGNSLETSEPPASVGSSSIFARVRLWQHRRRWAVGVGDAFSGPDVEQGLAEPKIRGDFVVSAVVGLAPSAAIASVTPKSSDADVLKIFNRAFRGPPPSFSTDSATESAGREDMNEYSVDDEHHFLVGDPEYVLSVEDGTRYPEQSKIASDADHSLSASRSYVNSSADSATATDVDAQSGEPMYVRTATDAADTQSELSPLPKSASRDSSEGELTLGSLVSKVTGNESLLDKCPDSSNEHTPERSNESPDRSNGILGLTQKLGLRWIPADGYRLLDDDRIETSYPISLPMEIFTHSIEQDMPPTVARNATKDVKQFVVEWNMLHSLDSSDDNEPEPVLNFSDDSDEEDPLSHEELMISLEEEPRSICLPSIPRKEPRRKKKRARSKHQSGRSVASSPSLLGTVITEETAEDLEDDSDFEQDTYGFDPYRSRWPLQRSLSAPNLASFAPIAFDGSQVIDTVKLLDTNRSNIVQSCRSEKSDDGRIEIPNVKADMTTASQDPSFATEAGPLSPWITVKVPTFSVERDIRAGIHAPDVVFPDTSENKQMPNARDVRDARIRRLKETRRPKTQSLDPPIRRRLFLNDDANSIMLDTLDLRLVDLQRPEGAEYGPDEVSL